MVSSCNEIHFLGDILENDKQLRGGLFTNFRDNQISKNAELPDGWRGDKSGQSEDYEWQWINNEWQWRPKVVT